MSAEGNDVCRALKPGTMAGAGGMTRPLVDCGVAMTYGEAVGIGVAAGPGLGLACASSVNANR